MPWAPRLRVHKVIESSEPRSSHLKEAPLICKAMGSNQECETRRKVALKESWSGFSSAMFSLRGSGNVQERRPGWLGRKVALEKS